MRITPTSCICRLTSLFLATLVTACAPATPQPSPPLIVQPAKLPPLPQSARQPEPPPECRPTCPAGLSRLLDSMLTSPVNVAPLAPSASAATTTPSSK